ncbi:ATP-NAD kinase family protein [Aliidiomarina soli]|nr:ATP-NAD kinase family protein [Aliidiomarina soli]
MMFRIGLVVNPYSGIGGAVGLKGSDGEATRQEALAKGAELKANQRVEQALQLLQPHQSSIQWLTASGAMGADVLQRLEFGSETLYQTPQQSEADDTKAAVSALVESGIDLLVFAGGDGTARDVYAVIGDTLPVVGIPAGVKIHSGVYAVSPKAAGRVLELLVSGQLTTVRHADVMDIDENAFRQGNVRARRYGEMLVPGELEYMQAVKMGGRESDELVLTDIADDVIENMEDDALYIMGSGSTVAALMEQMDLPNTLLGVDAIVNQQLIGSDLTAAQLEALCRDYTKRYLVITLIGGQGHIFGRGNQQLSPAVIKAVGRPNIIVVASKTKLKALEGRPLRVDTGDVELDQALTGFIQVTTGYHDQTMVAVTAVD